MSNESKLKHFLQSRVLDADKVESLEDLSEETIHAEKVKLTKKDSLRDFLVMENKDGEHLTLENEGLDDIIDKDESDLSGEERMLLYEKAMCFRRLGSLNHALLCFLGCLKGLQPSSQTKFTMLPQCLTHISEIYASAGDYQKAVEFMQGTKLYYETAIIEAGIQVDQYKKESGSEYRPLDLDPCLDEARRANEYERLSNSCLEQHKFQLALEYCGKSTKLRQKVYGDEHPLTVKSLDLFTLIYAEMGKNQYSEAMNKYGDIAKSIKEDEKKRKTEEMKVGEEMEENADKDSSAIDKDSSLVKDNEDDTKNVEDANKTDERSNNIDGEESANEDNSKDKLKNVRFSSSNRREAPLYQITGCQLLFFVILSAMFAVLFTYIWCYVTDSSSCPTQRYIFARARYWYYFYFKSAGTNSSFF